MTLIYYSSRSSKVKVHGANW